MENRETLTTSSGVLHYLHDAGNRLQEIRQGSDTGPLQASFQYDGNGNMTSRLDGSGQTVLEDSLGKSRYFLQGEHVEAVYGASNGQKRATWFRGAVIDEIVNGYVYDGAEAVNLTYHHDPLSSVVALTGHTGSVEEDIRYGPFGQVIATTGGTDNLLRYTGRDVDPDTGLYYYRARYYDPGLGRFLSEDPLGFGSGDVNFYAYVDNNPLTQSAPRGRIAETAWDVTNVGLGIASLGYNIAEGNLGWAAVDAAGLAYDATATAIPFLPAGFGAGLKAWRAGNAASDAAIVGLEVAHTADLAHDFSRMADGAGNAARVGSEIHRNVGNALDVGATTNNYFRGANRARGIQPDLSWQNAPGVWAELTTPSQWQAHASKYASFGEGIPLLYERGRGVVNSTRLTTGGGVAAPMSQIYAK